MASPANLVPPQSVAVGIGGRGYMVRYDEIIRRAAAGPADEFDQGAEPGERIPLAGAHQRIQRSFHGGAGQEFFDEPDSNRARFWRSSNVEVRVPGKLSLPTEGTVVFVGLSGDGATPERAPNAPGPYVITSANGAQQYLYLVSGTLLRRLTVPEMAGFGPIGTVANPTSLATFGGHVYAACGTELRRSLTSGTTSEVASTQDCDLVGFANGHLLIGHDETIYEVIDLSVVPAAATALFTSREPGDWTAIAESPGAIYAAYAAESGKATIYTWPDVADDSTLGIPIVAAPLNDYEVVYAMLCVGRVLCLGTTEGVRLCVIGGDGSLDVGPVIQPATPDQHARSTTEAATPGMLRCYGLAVIGDDLFAAGERTGSGTVHQVFRLDLGDFVGSLQPAYNTTKSQGTEVVATKPAASGYRLLVSWLQGDGGIVSGFAAAHLPDPSATQSAFIRASSGWLQSGWITFGKVNKHQPIEVVLYHDPIPTSATIGARIVDAGLVSTTLTGVTDGATATTFDATGLTPGRKFRVEVTMTRGGATGSTPVLNGGWSYRGQVLSNTQDEIIVPVILEPEFTGQYENVEELEPDAEYEFLKGLEGTITTYVEGGRTEKVQVASVGWERGDVRSMDTDVSATASLVGTLRVRMVTVA